MYPSYFARYSFIICSWTARFLAETCNDWEKVESSSLGLLGYLEIFLLKWMICFSQNKVLVHLTNESFVLVDSKFSEERFPNLKWFVFMRFKAAHTVLGWYCKQQLRGRRPPRGGQSWCPRWSPRSRSWSRWCCCTGILQHIPSQHTQWLTRKYVWILKQISK